MIPLLIRVVVAQLTYKNITQLASSLGTFAALTVFRFLVFFSRIVDPSSAAG